MFEDAKLQPAWYEGIPPLRSFRRLFKWGAVDRFKHPNARLYALMKETFHLSDADFRRPVGLGLEEVPADGAPEGPAAAHRGAFEAMIGAENVAADVYTRLRVSYGKTMLDLLRLREGIVESLPDLVLSPRHKADVAAIVAYAHEHELPVYVRGGGSSVTRGTECVAGGVSLDLTVHMRNVLRVDETDHTVTVEPGISGPDLEAALNDAPSRFGTRHRFTCGHFPQSFEFSTAGGWVVTRGAGQSSTYFGKIEDMVICQEVVTPAGTIETLEVPAAAVGPSLDRILVGSEGAFGVLVSVTLKIFRYRPKNVRRFSFVFRSWADAVAATREVMQSQAGFPSVFRLSDPEETAVALKLYGVEGTPLDAMMSLRGYRDGGRCLLIGSAEGDRDLARLVKEKVRAVCRDHGAMYTTGLVTRRWEHGRFSDPYLREDLGDHGIIIDTLECAVSWSTLEHVHREVRAYVKSRPDTVCMAHISHFYPQGANLYFIFIGRMDRAEYVDFHAGLLDAIRASGAALSHHHGVGKMIAPWIEAQLGATALGTLRAVKAYLDPKGIMNPGGTLALDLPDDARR